MAYNINNFRKFPTLEYHKAYKKYNKKCESKIPIPRPFKELNVTTHTIMVYTNLNFDTHKLFWNIKNTILPVSYKKKDAYIPPYGAILCIQSGTFIRGIVMRKKKKHWCTVCCQIKEQENNLGKGKKLKYITEQIVQDTKNPNLWHILYFCSFCNKIYDPRSIKKITHFPHQITLSMSVGNKSILNIMLFKDSLKIAGAKTRKDALEAIAILWQEYIVKIPGSAQIMAGKSAKFVFDIVMMNVGFSLGFPINRHILNDIMNNPEYSDIIFISCLQTTSNPNVNIKMMQHKPQKHYYDYLKFHKNKSTRQWDITLDRMTEISKVFSKKLKKPKNNYNTLIVFSSSETILTGRYANDMKKMYHFFLYVVYLHDLIQHIDPIDKQKLALCIKSLKS